MQNWEMIWKDADVHITMHELLERTRQCEGIAMDVCGQCLSYSEFHRRSDAFAAWLQEQGYGAGDTIILSMKASADLFCMIAGAMKALAVVTVTEDDVSPARLQTLQDQTGAVLRITDDQVENIYQAGRNLKWKKAADRVRPEEVYAIWYTSGTTGEPCGIQTMSYNTVCNIIPIPGNEIMSTCLKESSALLNISHPSCGLGFTNFFYALFYGKKFVHIQPGRENSIGQIAIKIRENPGCFLLFTPSAVAACMRDEEARSSLRDCSAVMMGADAVKSSLIAEVQAAMGPQGKVINLYGISDVGLVAVKIAREDDRLHAVGKPTACTEFLVVDENRRPLPPGEPGEFCITGIRVGPGYLKTPPAKRDKFVHTENGSFFYTGDYGYVDSEGEVFLLGRTDRLIKHLGYRVDSIEVEEVIRREARVSSVAVKQFERGNTQILCAFYENDRPLDSDELRRRLATVLPRYCVPERLIHMEKLPLTERGKLDYRALSLPEGLVRTAYAPAETERESIVCKAYEACLDVEKVGRNDSFFELGGNSIAVMFLLSRLGKEHGLYYTIENLFLNPRPCELARLSGQEGALFTAKDEAVPLPALPPELQHLKESGEIEEILPAEAASGLYLFLQESGSAYGRGLTFNLRVVLKHVYSEEAFRSRIELLTQRHPVLRSFFVKDRAGKRWQVFRRKGETPVYYRNLSGVSKEARERFLSGFFQVMDECNAPFQAGCFPLGEERCAVLLRLMHTHVDGMSAMLLVNELTDETEGRDCFYEYRKQRLQRRFAFPDELKEYYAPFGERMRLSMAPEKGNAGVEQRELALDEEQTQRVQERCADLGISLAGFVEYSFGRGLLTAMDRETVWFSHVCSGREAHFENSEATIGNLFYSVPVFLSADMSPQTFQKGLILPWKYPYITDTPEYQRLNRHNIEEGIVSRVFVPFHGSVESFSDAGQEMSTGHYMEIPDGKLRIVFRYRQDPLLRRAYDRIGAVMESILTE